MKTKSAVLTIVALVFIISALSGCMTAHDNGNEEVSETPKPGSVPNTASPEPSLAVGGVSDEEPEPTEETPTVQEPMYTNPLTGIASESDISHTRPTAVIFNNRQKATPQRGIECADILYEIPAEGGITRLIGVYMDISGAEQLGSIRSIRPYFVDIVKCIDPVIIHAGASNDAYVKMKSEGITFIDGVNGNSQIFFRDAWRKANVGYEHSLMVDTSLVPGYLEKKKIKTQISEVPDLGLSFGDSSAEDGDTAINLKVSLSNSKTTSFRFSESDGLYYASQFGAFMTDETTGRQLAVKNVIIMKTKMKVIDSEGRLAVTTTGSGDGWYACGGHYVPINWSRKSTTEPFKYTHSDGSIVTMGAGVTYVCVISTDMKASFE